jgi:hypothetical protein
MLLASVGVISDVEISSRIGYAVVDSFAAGYVLQDERPIPDTSRSLSDDG